jgi:predicted metal-dependent hydrolase
VQITYDVVYSKRRTISLIVERDNRVIVRAPEGTSGERIERVIENKKLWLFEKTQHPRKYPLRKHRKEIVSGESVLYLGHHYPLEIVDEDLPGLEFSASFRLPKALASQASTLFEAWYVRRAKALLGRRANRLARSLGVQYNKLLVSDLKYRWGSCTPKDNLNFNWRILKAPIFVIEYLIVHELAHLLEPNHTQRFWNIVAVQVPKHLEARQWLADNGNLLEVDF